MSNDTTHVTVTRTIDSAAKDIFAVLTLPARHHEFDGSGMVRNADDTERITAAGEKFVMNMHGEHMGGDYRTHNFVTAYDENKMIGWQPAPEAGDGTAPTEPLAGSGSTSRSPSARFHPEVSSPTTGPRHRPEAAGEGGFPAIPQEDSEQSLNLLAAAVTKP